MKRTKTKTMGVNLFKRCCRVIAIFVVPFARLVYYYRQKRYILLLLNLITQASRAWCEHTHLPPTRRPLTALLNHPQVRLFVCVSVCLDARVCQLCDVFPFASFTKRDLRDAAPRRCSVTCDVTSTDDVTVPRAVAVPTTTLRYFDCASLAPKCYCVWTLLDCASRCRRNWVAANDFALCLSIS